MQIILDGNCLKIIEFFCRNSTTLLVTNLGPVKEPCKSVKSNIIWISKIIKVSYSKADIHHKSNEYLQQLHRKHPDRQSVAWVAHGYIVNISSQTKYSVIRCISAESFIISTFIPINSIVTLETFLEILKVFW